MLQNLLDHLYPWWVNKTKNGPRRTIISHENGQKGNVASASTPSF